MRNTKMMRMARLLAAASALVLMSGFAGDTALWAAGHSNSESSTAKGEESDAARINKYFRADESTSEGSVRVEGNTIDYRAVAGTLIVHPKGWDDAEAERRERKAKQDAADEASMFYVAYFKRW